ncbi:MAG: poly-beta-1,6-N-acetyl-D-glucosamine N-deacetylase PgaB [Deferribacterota bacterium]|nr:poly-beta-1,6-N-acetyl-D-glucosamine N-deacetylase PgaB [Deferribacterota bacterium]
MKYLIYILVILVFLVFTIDLYALNLVSDSYYRVKGIQIFNFNISEKQLDSYLADIKKKGFNTIFVRVFHNKNDRYHFNINSTASSGVYFKTNQVYVIKDILRPLLIKAKKYNLKVFAWMATRSLDALKESYNLDKTFKIDNLNRSGYGVNLFNNNVFSKIIALFKDLAMYDIDGILIQDDFILKIDESASIEAKKRFFVDRGFTINNNTINNKDISKAFTDWKINQMRYFLNKIIWSVKLIDPSIKIAINIYYETPYKPNKAKKWYAQSLSSFKSIDVDYFAYMSYHIQMAKELNCSFLDVLNIVNKSIRDMTKIIKPTKRIIAKFQIKDFHNKEYIEKKELNKLCYLINNYDEISYTLLPFENIKDLEYNCY